MSVFNPIWIQTSLQFRLFFQFIFIISVGEIPSRQPDTPGGTQHVLLFFFYLGGGTPPKHGENMRTPPRNVPCVLCIYACILYVLFQGNLVVFKSVITFLHYGFLQAFSLSLLSEPDLIFNDFRLGPCPSITSFEIMTFFSVILPGDKSSKKLSFIKQVQKSQVW